MRGCSELRIYFFFFFCLIWLVLRWVLLQTIQGGHGLVELGLDPEVIVGEGFVLGLEALVVLGQLDVLTLKLLNLQVELTNPMSGKKTRVDWSATRVQLLS